MNLQAVWQALETSAVGDFVASSSWAFPAVESAHVIAIVTVVGTVAIMDFRLLGLTSRSWAVTQVSHDTLRWTWLAFALAVVTGSLLFASKAHVYAREPYFLWKMVLLALAGVNMAVFHVLTWRNIARWDASPTPPLGGRIAGVLSLVCWVLAIFCGRFIGFTLGQYE
ncbi:MAG: DUF6644 family protein [Caulobacteraceae bacterium]